MQASLIAPGAYYLEVYEFHSDISPLKNLNDIKTYALCAVTASDGAALMRVSPSPSLCSGSIHYEIRASWYEKDIAPLPVAQDQCYGSGYVYHPD